MTVADLELFARTNLVPLALKLALALLIFLVGRQLAKLVVAGLEHMMDRSSIDVSLRKFLSDIVYAVLLVSVAIAALDAVGVQTTAVIAVLGAAGLAIGLSLQGSLSNFAAGVMLIGLRPYKIGDLVAIDKFVGRVDVIRVFHTILITADHREITIPNGLIIAKPIENLTALGHRRVDLVVQVAQAADVVRVRQLLESIVNTDPRIQQAPAPAIEVAELSDAGMKLYLRPWTAVENYAKVAAETMERIKSTMESAQLRYSVSLQAVP